MSVLADWPAWGLLLAASGEAIARINYRHRFQMGWRSRRIGEYPYRHFIEKAPEPLFFRFKKNFRSRSVATDRFGMRSPEPAPDGSKNRIMVIGESVFFGAKLLRQRDLWGYRLQDRLEREGRSRWEVLNAGVPGYNAVQYHAWLRQTLKAVRPQILVLQMGGNDISQAYVMGDKWRPGAPWPWEFIMAQQRRSPWWNKIAARSCAHFLWRRSKMTERKGFENSDGVFKLDECVSVIEKETRAIVDDARSMGIKVVFTSYAWAFDQDSIEKEPPQLDAIQSNWRESFLSTGKVLIDFGHWWLTDFSRRLDCPSIDLMTAFWNHPNRFQLYLDVAHWNDRGHQLVAEVLFDQIGELGYW